MFAACRAALFVIPRRSALPVRRILVLDNLVNNSRNGSLIANYCLQTSSSLNLLSFYNNRPLLCNFSSRNLTLTPNRSLRASNLTRDVENGKSKSVQKPEDEEPKGLFAKFKFLWKRYWYIVIPVHLVTSCFWFGGGYYMAASGIDVVGFLQSLSFIPEAWLTALQKATWAGNLAVAYALYKLLTPARYMVTIGGTHMVIKYGSSFGILRTSTQVKEDMKDYYSEKKDNFNKHRLYWANRHQLYRNQYQLFKTKWMRRKLEERKKKQTHKTK